MFAAASVSGLAVVAAVDPEDVKPGWTAFVVVVLLVVAVVFLLRSFVKQTKRVNFTEEGDDEPEGPDEDDPDR